MVGSVKARQLPRRPLLLMGGVFCGGVGGGSGGAGWGGGGRSWVEVDTVYLWNLYDVVACAEVYEG